MLRARNGLRHLAGIGRPATAQTPADVTWQSRNVRLLRYRSDQRTVNPPLLIVHSLVSRSYVFDLVPGNSIVETLLGLGFDVHLVDWGVPDEVDSKKTLSTYVDRHLPDIVRAVRQTTGANDMHVLGYCFGGILALLHAAAHPDGVRSLAIAATPVDFRHMGPFPAMLAHGRVRPEDITDHTGNVPAEVMINSVRALAPTANVSAYATLWQNLWSDDYVKAYQTIGGWTSDHIPFPGGAFHEIVELFFRDNQLPTGQITLSGRTIDLADLHAPILRVYAERDNLVPPAATEGIDTRVGSAVVDAYPVPTGHIGIFVSGSAHRTYMPHIATWYQRWSDKP